LNFEKKSLILKIFEIFEIFGFYENLEILNFKKKFNFKFFENFVPNKYKTFIQFGRGTKNPRKRFTLPVHSLKNYGPLNSQTTGKGEK
jgi:hypothetical protein